MHTRFTDAIEWVNIRVGEFVAYWAVISVFGYYYEVIARFAFNSPTNWLHESMFLMYGMQYMLAGAYAYQCDQHVRVDVFYAKFSTRGKAIADIITSVFFFIFVVHAVLDRAGASRIDSFNPGGVGEVSFTEWGVQYWPVKLMMPIGAALLAAAGHLQADQRHHHPDAWESLSHGLGNRYRMADAAAVRLARRAAGARPADGVLHRLPRGRLPLPVRQFGHPEHDAVAHLPVHDRLPALRRAAVHLHGGDAGEGRHHRGAVRRGL